MEVECAVPGGPLRGTWAVAEGAQRMALLLPGSGPVDRDGNPAARGLYRAIAEGIATRGCASLRADKRGLFGSAAPGQDPNAVTLKDYAEDALRWSHVMRAQAPGAALWLIGHSEGGLIALMAAARIKAAGVILLACPGRRLDVVLAEQLSRDFAQTEDWPAIERTMQGLTAGKHVDTYALPAPLQGLFAPQVQGLLISLFAADPEQLTRHCPCPVFALQGDADEQVKLPDAEGLAQAGAEKHVLKGADHCFFEVPEGGLHPELIPHLTGCLACSKGL